MRQIHKDGVSYTRYICDCGASYADEAGILACASGNHGRGFIAPPQTMTRSIEIMDAISARLRMSPDEKERYLWLALAGEVGEACNLVKKQWRDGFTAERVEKLKTELADVYIYLRVLESFYGINVHLHAQQKMLEVECRPFANPEHKEISL